MTWKRFFQLGFISLGLVVVLCVVFPAHTLAFDPSSYFNPSYSATFSRSTFSPGESITTTITGKATCTADLPLSISQATITGRIIAQRANSSFFVVVNPGYTVTMDSFPRKKGESISASETVILTFPADMPLGRYSIIGQVISARIKLSGVLWVDATQYAPANETLGVVKVVPKQFLLTVRINGNGSTNFPPTALYRYDEGSIVDLLATPTSGWEFVNWTGDEVADPNLATTTVVMDNDKTVTANFIQSTAPPFTTTPPPTAAPPPTTALPPTTAPLPTTASPATTTPPPTTAPPTTAAPPPTTAPPSTTAHPPTTAPVTTPTAATPADTNPPFISNVLLVHGNNTEVYITWTTVEPADSQVQYWAGPHQFTILDTMLVTEHAVYISGLDPNATYRFKILSRDKDGNLTTMLIPASDNSGIKWWVVGVLSSAALISLLLVSRGISKRRHTSPLEEPVILELPGQD